MRHQKHRLSVKNVVVMKKNLFLSFLRSMKWKSETVIGFYDCEPKREGDFFKVGRSKERSVN